MSERSVALPFDPTGIVLDRRQGLSRQLYQALRQRVLDGRLGSGTRLPATRDMAAALAVSRNSVVRAYDQLYAEGYIESRVGDGTYVSQLPKLSTKLSTGLSLGFSTGLSTKTGDCTEDLSSKVIHTDVLERLENNHLSVHEPRAPRAFQVGIPAFDLFPFEVWAKLQAGFWRNPDPASLSYGDPAGEPLLRELIATYLRRSRGLSCVAEQIVITSGAQQAISLCAQLLLAPGDGVAVENPGYRAAGKAFAMAGAKVHGVGVDHDGLQCAALAQLSNCRLSYVTPAHQYPTGVTLSLARRLELLAWAERNDSWIIEDDYDGEYRYSGAPLAPLAALDRSGRVLYVGTFGKVAFPALRLGYLVLPARAGGGILALSGVGGAPFRGRHTGGDGAVHGQRALPASYPAHAPRGVEPAQCAAGRVAEGCGGAGSLAGGGGGPAPEDRRAQPGARTGADRPCRSGGCRTQCAE